MKGKLCPFSPRQTSVFRRKRTIFTTFLDDLHVLIVHPSTNHQLGDFLDLVASVSLLCLEALADDRRKVCTLAILDDFLDEVDVHTINKGFPPFATLLSVGFAPDHRLMMDKVNHTFVFSSIGFFIFFIGGKWVLGKIKSFPAFPPYRDHKKIPLTCKRIFDCGRIRLCGSQNRLCLSFLSPLLSIRRSHLFHPKSGDRFHHH